MSGTCANSIGNEAMPVVVHHPSGVGGSLASAVNSNSLGVGYSGSGFLIFYFVGKQTFQAGGPTTNWQLQTGTWQLCASGLPAVAVDMHQLHNPVTPMHLTPCHCPAGVTSILKHLGIISNTTRLAGSSGGAAVAAASCAGLEPSQQYQFLLQMADHCRPSGGCRGFLGSVVSKQLHSVLPPEAPRLCSGRLYAAVTAAKPDGLPDPHMLLGSKWADKEQLVSAVSASCYLPALSGPSATMKLDWKPEAGAVYDGGFSYRLPCPPGGSLT